ncbi:MAG: choice-of-anchor R domain-containing protein [Rariglobus sp.]
MQTPRLKTSFLVLTVLLAFCTSSVRADIIFGNLGGYTNDGGQGGVGTPINAVNDSGGNNSVLGKGVGFTMGLAAYDVTSITLRLNNVNDTPGVDVPTVAIYTTRTGTPTNGSSQAQALSLLGTFNNPSFTAGSTAANYTFTPAAPITLNAGTRYLIIVRQANFVPNTTQEFNWLNGNPTVTPAGVAGSAYAVYGTSSTPSTWNQTTAQYNWFQIEGTVSAIPEPGTYAMLLGAAALAFTVTRRSRRHTS